jgi:hypothetical protein
MSAQDSCCSKRSLEGGKRMNALEDFPFPRILRRCLWTHGPLIRSQKPSASFNRRPFDIDIRACRCIVHVHKSDANLVQVRL